MFVKIILFVTVFSMAITDSQSQFFRDLGDEINTLNDEFLPYIYNDTLYFRRTLNKAPWKYEILYIAVSDIPATPNPINMYSIQSYISNQKTYEDNKPKLNPNDPTTPSLRHFSQNKLSYLGAVRNLGPVVNSKFNDMHPAISADGNYIVFVSDRPGGINNPKGGVNTDLWITFKKRGAWTTPKNLGKKINTAANELAPFIDEDGTLYFSSSGYIRDSVRIYFSGENQIIPARQRDIFTRSEDTSYNIIKAYYISKGKWGNTELLPFPINTQFNEIGYTRNKEQEIVASDRPSGITSPDDVVQGNPIDRTFDLFGYLDCKKLLLRGKVNISPSYIPLYGVIKVYDESNKLISSIETDGEGKFVVLIPYTQKVNIFYKNACLNGEKSIGTFNFDCNPYGISNINIRTKTIKYGPTEKLFPEDDIPMFVTGYYKPLTQKDLDYLRRMFNSFYFGNSLSTKYILNPDRAVTNYDNYVPRIEAELDSISKFVANNVIRLFYNLCGDPPDIVSVRIYGYGELNAMPVGSQYVGQNINDRESGFSIKKGDFIDKEKLGQLRAYYIKEIIKQKLRTNEGLRKNNLINRIQWHIEGIKDLSFDSKYKSGIATYNGKIKIVIGF